ncbi:hypothetical protein HDG34_005831 [Paraburkholderia sp. HC6.4b]|uniref:KTSC domain-containing protein n=1 Tax=unclassified Paraburkholderia TaxID=2615204 RepID=UPI0018225DEF|nr:MULTISPECIES: KTSC domain-containing protein [unclassified Paraburkholderia]MBB5411865.1 hypothetical protein [Paraburkholderia sp. HC6.4b]MBB5450177.1 hypothetical protein [Paraburkholderia sp. Kb1A]
MQTNASNNIVMKEVESSQIHSIGHDPEKNILAVRFKNKGGAPSSLYQYSNFHADEFEQFASAESIGSHFHKHIKPLPELYPYERITIVTEETLRALQRLDACDLPEGDRALLAPAFAALHGASVIALPDELISRVRELAEQFLSVE